MKAEYYLLFNKLVKLKERKSTKIKIRLKKIHNRLGSRERNPAIFRDRRTNFVISDGNGPWEPGTYPGAGTHQGHIQGPCKMNPTYKTLKIE